MGFETALVRRGAPVGDVLVKFSKVDNIPDEESGGVFEGIAVNVIILKHMPDFVKRLSLGDVEQTISAYLENKRADRQELLKMIAHEPAGSDDALVDPLFERFMDFNRQINTAKEYLNWVQEGGHYSVDFVDNH